jgi:hypothetical protein
MGFKISGKFMGFRKFEEGNWFGNRRRKVDKSKVPGSLPGSLLPF